MVQWEDRKVEVDFGEETSAAGLPFALPRACNGKSAFNFGFCFAFTPAPAPAPPAPPAPPTLRLVGVFVVAI